MKQSLPLSTRREVFHSARLRSVSLSIGLFIFFSLQPTNAVEEEVKNFEQSKGAGDLLNGTVYDGTASRSMRVPSIDTRDVSADLPYKYFGNSFSGKFHRPWCPYSQAMNLNHAVAFNFRWQAIRSGYRPCNFCLPQQWKSVHCVLLKQTSRQ
jgi:hypothetical protein